MSREEIFRRAIANAASRSGGPGAAAFVGDLESDYFHAAVGNLQDHPKSEPAKTSTIYDLASLTKVVSTTTLVLKLHDQGKIDLGQSVTDFVPIPAYSDITIRHLLTHTAGLAPGYAYATQHTRLLPMVKHMAERGLEARPGLRYQYSDIGFMLLGLVVEAAGADRLDTIAHRLIFQPLGMTDTGFNPAEDKELRCAATEDCAWRGYVVRGAVHDENAFAVGGVSGHAGLFSTTADLAKFCRAMLSGDLLEESTFNAMTTLGQVPSYPWQGLGWKLDPWLDDSRGAIPSRAAFGHTGWTGTSIYMDRKSGIFAIQLGNTCHPSRTQRSNRRFRQTFYIEVANELFQTERGVHTGLDRMVRDGFSPLRGKRYALLTNSAAVDQLGRPILDVLSKVGGMPPHIIFSPEHGFARQGEAGEKIASQAGDVPIVSLYGDRTQPTPEDLDEINLFVVDLQDIGSRYYTYMHTMRLCIEACAKSRVPILVLDRPNPLGGAIVEGPMPAKTGSPVCTAEIPVRHGRTMGELAVFFAKDVKPKPNLEVSLMDNWLPSLLFGQCSLPWVAPSPNMPSALTALVYTGTCLIEGANLNEGRGTDAPFLRFGAPWMDPASVISAIDPNALEGVMLRPEMYIPKSIPGKASNPKHEGRMCKGIHLDVTNAHAMSPVALTASLLVAIREVHGDALELSPFFDTLAGGPALRNFLDRAPSHDELQQFLNASARAFAMGQPTLYDRGAVKA